MFDYRGESLIVFRRNSRAAVSPYIGEPITVEWRIRYLFRFEAKGYAPQTTRFLTNRRR